MGRILEYIQKNGGSKYICYQTRKLSLEANDKDMLLYDDKPISEAKAGVFAESDRKRMPVVRIPDALIRKTIPIFRYFLDGSRRTYKVDDIAIGKNIFPIMAGQIVVGCCERKSRDIFKKYDIRRELLMAMPDEFDDDDGGENFCRLYCENLNKDLQNIRFVAEKELTIDKLLLYQTDGKSLGKDKDNYKNRAIARVQAEMTDNEQLLVADLCAGNKLDDDSWLIKDGSLEYNPRYSNLERTQWNNLRANYRHVIGVSKSFDPQLLPDYEGHRLAKTIASLKPFHRTKVYRYDSAHTPGTSFAVWYLRLRDKNFRETQFSDVVKCEVVLLREGQTLDSELVDTISANLIQEAYPVCHGTDSRWANHLYPIFLTESFCKSHYIDNNIILSLV
ncbi:MAG: hypothetical protein LUG98_01435 [Tannerellaceae bacterium]|nr:hypothetical protein [Tannerellaceae bacterium]